MSVNQWLLQPEDIFARSPIVPVMVINKLEHAVPLARALVAGGIGVLEVTLRTSCALAAIGKIAAEVPDALVGAGTVLNETQLHQAVAAGAKFTISPGAFPALLQAGRVGNVPLIPGVTTISEVMTGMTLGYRNFKFFPAEVAGGINALKAFSGPLPDIRFCPTGGITASSYKNYLALNNVACIGGSWIAPTEAMEQGDWDRITRLCREALAGLAQ